MIFERVYTRKQIKNRKISSKKRRTRLLVYLVLCFLVIAIFALIIVKTKPFEIKNVSFADGEGNSNPEVLELLGTYTGQNYVKLMFENGFFAGAKNFFAGDIPQIESVMVFEFPLYKNISAKIKNGTLMVEGEERRNFVVLSCSGESLVADTDGTLLFVCETGETEQVISENLRSDWDNITLSGLKIENYVVGKKLTYEDNIAWTDIISLYFMIYADDTLDERISLVYFADETHAFFYCENNIVVEFGSVSDKNNAYDRLERLSAILRSESAGLSDGTIVMTDSGYDTWKPNSK